MLWEKMLKRDWSTASEISGRAYPIPSLGVPGGRASSTCQTRYWGLTEKHPPLCKLLSLRCCLQLLRPGRVSGDLCTERGWREEPYQLPIRAWHTGTGQMQPVDGEDAVVPDRANRELFGQVKEWHCCSKYIQKQEIKFYIFSF